MPKLEFWYDFASTYSYLTVNGNLDHETVDLHAVTIKATDANGISYEKTIQVHVLDAPESTDEGLTSRGTLTIDADTALAAANGGDSQVAIEDYLNVRDTDVQQAILSRLLWLEFRQLRDDKAFIDKDQYYERFPEDKTLVKAVYYQASNLPLLTSQQIFLVAGVMTVPVCCYIFFLIPQASIRFLVWLASCTVYRVKVYGRENLPATGGALLVPNHVSWIDGVLLLLTSSRPIRMVAFAGNM